LSPVASRIIGIGGVGVGGGVEGVCGEGEIGLGRVDWGTAETGEGDSGVVWVVKEILLRGEDVVEREGLGMVYLLIVGERRGRMARPDGCGLTVEFYKRAATLARDAFSWVGEMSLRFYREGGRKLTAGVGAVAGKVCDHALVAGLLGGGGAGGRGGGFAPVVGGTGGFLGRVALVYVPGEEIAPGKLVSAVLALVRPVAGVCMGGVGEREQERGEREEH
jgi:hypothetical protein